MKRSVPLIRWTLTALTTAQPRNLKSQFEAIGHNKIQTTISTKILVSLKIKNHSLRTHQISSRSRCLARSHHTNFSKYLFHNLQWWRRERITRTQLDSWPIHSYLSVVRPSHNFQTKLVPTYWRISRCMEIKVRVKSRTNNSIARGWEMFSTLIAVITTRLTRIEAMSLQAQAAKASLLISTSTILRTRWQTWSNNRYHSKIYWIHNSTSLI